MENRWRWRAHTLSLQAPPLAPPLPRRWRESVVGRGTVIGSWT